MGTGLSKHEDELKRDATTSDKELSTPMPDPPGSSRSTNNSETSSGCPMKRSDGSYEYSLKGIFCKQFPHLPGGSTPLTKEEAQAKAATPTSSSSAGCPIKHENTSTGSSGCPIKSTGNSTPQYNVYGQPIDPSNNMPKYANQMPAPGQTKALSTDRVPSSIPKGGGNLDQDTKSTWVYPSTQMFYNALARKGKLGDTKEEDIENIVAIHNNMNEKTWKQVCEWERVLNPSHLNGPKLLKFQGRPSDLSPKAAIKHYILGHPLPYDRHDWTILRDDGETVRYVIDYYHDETKARDDPDSAFPNLDDHTATPSLLVDVRPALDSPSAFWYRAVSMPYARAQKTTTFNPLPMAPEPHMKSQVNESVQVWESIQQAARGIVADKEVKPIDEETAKRVATNFASALKGCQKAKKKMDRCSSEEDCARASVDLTLCMAKILCPLQQQKFTQTLEDGNDDQIESSLNIVNECVIEKTREYKTTRDKFPALFK